jgi:hypothetical protein
MWTGKTILRLNYKIHSNSLLTLSTWKRWLFRTQKVEKPLKEFKTKFSSGVGLQRIEEICHFSLISNMLIYRSGKIHSKNFWSKNSFLKVLEFLGFFFLGAIVTKINWPFFKSPLNYRLSLKNQSWMFIVQVYGAGYATVHQLGPHHVFQTFKVFYQTALSYTRCVTLISGKANKCIQ